MTCLIYLEYISYLYLYTMLFSDCVCLCMYDAKLQMNEVLFLKGKIVQYLFFCFFIDCQTPSWPPIHNSFEYLLQQISVTVSVDFFFSKNKKKINKNQKSQNKGNKPIYNVTIFNQTIITRIHCMTMIHRYYRYLPPPIHYTHVNTYILYTIRTFRHSYLSHLICRLMLLYSSKYIRSVEENKQLM